MMIRPVVFSSRILSVVAVTTNGRPRRRLVWRRVLHLHCYFSSFGGGNRRHTGNPSPRVVAFRRDAAAKESMLTLTKQYTDDDAFGRSSLTFLMGLMTGIGVFCAGPASTTVMDPAVSSTASATTTAATNNTTVFRMIDTPEEERSNNNQRRSSSSIHNTCDDISSWVTESLSTSVECRTVEAGQQQQQQQHQQQQPTNITDTIPNTSKTTTPTTNPTTTTNQNNQNDDEANPGDYFDPYVSPYYELKLRPNNTEHAEHSTSKTALSVVSSSSTSNATTDSTNDRKNKEHPQQVVPQGSEYNSTILPNTIVVVPNLMTDDECQNIVAETKQIIQDDQTTGCKTETWISYGRYDPTTTQPMLDRILVEQVLVLLRARMPILAHDLHITEEAATAAGPENGTSRRTTKTRQDLMKQYWDDPVVIQYTDGNELAPHNDLRDLTIVIPLQYPPASSEDHPTTTTTTTTTPAPAGHGKGGTKFWLQGIDPEAALETIKGIQNQKNTSTNSNTNRRIGDLDCVDDGGVDIAPAVGSGIVFNGEITHTGAAVLQGTRYVLMTSITLDDEDEYDDEDDDDEEEDSSTGDHTNNTNHEHN